MPQSEQNFNEWLKTAFSESIFDKTLAQKLFDYAVEYFNNSSYKYQNGMPQYQSETSKDESGYALEKLLTERLNSYKRLSCLIISAGIFSKYDASKSVEIYEQAIKISGLLSVDGDSEVRNEMEYMIDKVCLKRILALKPDYTGNSEMRINRSKGEVIFTDNKYSKKFSCGSGCIYLIIITVIAALFM